MPAPLVYIDRSEIVDGCLEQVKSAIKELAEFIEAAEPQILSYAVYVDPDGAHMNVIHIHRDSASLDHHFDVAGPRFVPFASLVRLLSIDVYGQPDAAVVQKLHDKARLLGGATVTVHPFHAGFVRVPSTSPASLP